MSSKKRTAKDCNLGDSEEPAKKRQRTNEESVELKELMGKYKEKQQENIVLKQNLLDKTIGVCDESNFPNIEEFVQEYKVFINQTHNNLLNELMDILEEIMENNDEDGSDENEDDDIDMDQDDNGKPDIQSIKLYKIGYEMLYHIISACYQAMTTRKDTFYQIIRQLLHLKNKQSNNHKISMFIDLYLQTKWDTFVENKYYTLKLSEDQSSVKKKRQRKRKKKQSNSDDDKKDEMDINKKKMALIGFEHENIDKIIDDIYDGIKEKLVSNTSRKYSELFMMCKTRNSLDIHYFIGQCCVLFWIMILYKQPKLRLSHESFWIDKCGDKFTEIDGCMDLKKLTDDSKSQKKVVKYCGIPGIIVENSIINQNNKNTSKNAEIVTLIEPHIFIHSHPLIINTLKT